MSPSIENADIYKKIQSICSDVSGIDAAEIRPNWSFFEDFGVGMDEFAEILSRVSLEFAVKIKREHVEEFVTIGNLVDFIEEQQS
jgi:acyl carrier protein